MFVEGKIIQKIFFLPEKKNFCAIINSNSWLSSFFLVLNYIEKKNLYKTKLCIFISEKMKSAWYIKKKISIYIHLCGKLTGGIIPTIFPHEMRFIEFFFFFVIIHSSCCSYTCIFFFRYYLFHFTCFSFYNINNCRKK